MGESYMGKDNLLHCTKCKEPLERPLPNALLGTDYKAPRMCSCERKRIEERKRALERREKQMVLENNRSVCFHERRMLHWTFENDNGKTPAMDKARTYVEYWQEARSECAGLLLWGGVGSGKTYMAACIANALLDQGKKVLMIDFVSITNISMYDIHEYVNALSNYDLLIIDDLGAERKQNLRCKISLM